MNKGIEILLERMKSNPDEFVPEYEGGSTKWNAVMSTYRNFLAKDELEAFDKAQREVVFATMQERFTQRVMKELLDPKSEETEAMQSMRSSIKPSTATQLGGATQGGYSNVSGLTLATAPNGNLQWVNSATATQATLTIGQTPISEHELQQMKAQTEYMRIQIEAEKAKAKQKTLVGKLYNYLGSNK